MQELRLVAVSEDGTYLVLATAGRGTRFTLPVDDRLRAAVRGHFSRLGQFEIEVESPLRPKEIQARIRSGETAEEIAESAGIPVERIRWFEGPVLQEREYMAQQAQRVTVRRPGDSTPGPPLGETVEERLGRGGVDLEEVEWDSWKCEDNTWRVRLSFFDNGRPHAAEWVFDPRRRHVSPLDEVAARLTAVEWDEESLSDTVTPLVPRRPAMKVVSSDRGIPAEPEQPGPGPLRAAEPRDYALDRGRVLDPHPTFPSTDPTPLREAAQLRGAGRPREAVEPAGRDAPQLRQAAPPSEARTAHEAAQARTAPEGTRPSRTTTRDHSRPRDTETQEATALREDFETPQAAQPAGDIDDREGTGGHVAAEPRDLVQPRQTSRSREAEHQRESTAADEFAQALAEVTPASRTTTPRDDARAREAAALGEEPGTHRSGQPGETGGERAAASLRDAQPRDAEAPEAAAPREDFETEQASWPAEEADDGEAAAPREAAQGVGARRAATSRGQMETPGDDEARQAADEYDETEADESAAVQEADEEQAPARSRTRTAERVAPQQDDDVMDEESAADEDGADEADGDEAPAEEKAPAARKGAAGQRSGHRPPAKKPAGRPAAPAAQDKPAAASETPAAAQRPAARGRRKAKGKRASVPSWDEIMFGARRPE